MQAFVLFPKVIVIVWGIFFWMCFFCVNTYKCVSKYVCFEEPQKYK